MRVKAADIARELGLSKATVSLALNDKPGVNPKTRQRILECKERLETPGTGLPFGKKQQDSVIRILLVSNGLNVAKNSEIDLWTDVNTVFDTVAKGWGYSVEIAYYDILHDSETKMVTDCNRAGVVGIVLFGTELLKDDLEHFTGIDKPMVIYDCDLGSERYSCVVVDNAGGVKKAVKYLVQHGKRNIVYLSIATNIYNLEQRRSGFRHALQAYGLPYSEDKQMVITGDTIDEITVTMRGYLEHNQLPDAFIMESYHVSIGCIRACRERGVQIPGQVSLVGIDELPEYMTGELKLTTVQIPHTERAKMVMTILWNEIQDGSVFKSRVFTDCHLIEGGTVI